MYNAYSNEDFEEKYNNLKVGESLQYEGTDYERIPGGYIACIHHKNTPLFIPLKDTLNE